MPDHGRFLADLAKADIGVVARDEPLRNHTHWKIGGPADLLVEPRRADQVSTVLRKGAEANVPVVVMGGGSNLLFDDAGVRGIVLKIGPEMAGYTIDGDRVQAAAGVFVPSLARAIGKAGLSGFEHAIGIPATLGGLIHMNGGSQRRSIGEIVSHVEAIDRSGSRISMSPEECEFSYRHSAFQSLPYIVISAELQCAPGDPRLIQRKMLDLLRERRSKFPLRWPNCGSVFTGDPEIYERFGPPGKIIEETGLKGFRVGDAQISHRHANFIVNLGQAKAADVLQVIHHIRDAVHERNEVWMKCEVRYVSPEGEIRPAHEALQ